MGNKISSSSHYEPLTFEAVYNDDDPYGSKDSHNSYTTSVVASNNNDDHAQLQVYTDTSGDEILLSEPSPRDKVAGKASYGTIAGFAVIINCIIGTGVFGLPYAFWEAGIPFGIILTVIMFVLTFVSCCWVLELMARAQGYQRVTGDHAIGDGSGRKPLNNLVYEKFDYTKCCQTFAGLPGKIVSEIVMTFYCYGCLWASVSVFASSLSSLVLEFVPSEGHCDIYKDPSSACQGAYYASAVFFGICVVTMSLLDVTQQIKVQMFLTGYRFVGFALMLVTIFVALGVAGPLPPPSYSASTSSASVEVASFQASDAWGFHPSGFAILVTSAAYAYTVHYNMPDALTPVRNKYTLRQIMLAGLFTSMLFFLLMGIVCAYFFNGLTDPLVILNWASYTGLNGGWGEGTRTWYAWIIYTIITLYPILNLISVYPLIAISLASNLIHLFPKSFTEKRARIANYTSRIAAALPPIIAGTAFGDLDVIFTFTGLFAFFIQFFIPAVMWELSRRKMEKQFGKGAAISIYTSKWTSNSVSVWVGFTLGVLAFSAAILNVVNGFVKS
ncbi:Transmembrane protein [Pelomyxa schiedti]|nr:Transmembrane protein [Pelomyxa schiedti]